MTLRSLLVATAALLSASAANAASYAFSYLSDPIQFFGQMTGTLQGDGNTFYVTSVSNLFLNGDPLDPHPFVGPVPFFGGSTALVTLDGSNMDLSACIDAGCTYGFLISTAPGIILEFGSPLIGFVYPEISTVALPFDAGGWSMTPINGAVPEPQSWALLIAGFGLTGAVLRRRRALQPALVRIRR